MFCVKVVNRVLILTWFAVAQYCFAQVAVSPARIDFTASPDDVPTTSADTITVTGAAIADFFVYPSGSWLSATRQGNGLKVSANRAGLPNRSDVSGLVYVVAGNQVRTVKVRMQLFPEVPFDVDAPEIEFSTVTGTIERRVTVTLKTNVTTDDTNVRVQLPPDRPEGNWLAVSPSSVSLTNSRLTGTFTVRALPNAVIPGDYISAIEFSTAPGSSNEGKRSVTVRLIAESTGPQQGATYTISGRVRDANGSPMANVSMAITGVANVTTDATGFYSVALPRGWTGFISPVSGSTFDPAQRYFTSLSVDVPNQDFQLAAGSTVTQSNPVMTQIATGGAWKTTLILVNTTDSPSPFTLQFRDDNGRAWPISVLRLGPTQADLGNVSTLTDTVPANGMWTYQTREQPSAAVQSGYAELTSGTGIRGQAIFQQSNTGGFDYEAAVPMGVGSKRFFLPFDNSAATTSMAVVNQGSTATVTARIRNEQGQLTDTRLLSLSAGQHRADTLANLVGAGVSSGARRGTIDFESDGPNLASLGLRFRESFTSFAPIPAGAANPSGANPVMAQVAAGGEWKTTILLVNTTDAAQSFTLRFRQAGASTWAIPLQRVGPNSADLGAISTLTDTIPAYGIYTYQTRDTPQVAVTSGFAELTSGAGIRGQAIFQQTLPGGVLYEAAVPMEPGTRRFLVPYDNVTAASRSTTTSIALANASPLSAASLQFTVRDDLGATLATNTITLNPGQHTASPLAGLVGDRVNGRRGTVEFSATGSDVNALGLRFRGPFTSFAVIPK